MPDVDDPVRVTEEPSAETDGSIGGGFLGGYSDFVLYGLYNGAFAKGPPDPAANITPSGDLSSSNFMPHWRFVQSSNTNITAKHVRDTASPSGSNLRFTVASGLAGDEAFVEQIVDIGGWRSRGLANVVNASLVNSGAKTFTAELHLQYLDATGAAVGNETNDTASPAPSVVSYLSKSANASDGVSPPATARWVRIRLQLRRGAALATDTGSIDFTDVRRDPGHAYVLAVERDAPASYAAASFSQSFGVARLAPDGRAGAALEISRPGGWARLIAAHAQLSEIAAPGTPDSGYYAIYAKTDGILYGKNDAGTERRLDAGYSEDTFTPTVTFDTPGNLSVAYTRQVGRYTKIGNRVHYSIRVVTSTFTHTTATGAFRIAGLPFTSANITDHYWPAATRMSGWTRAGYSAATAFVMPNATHFLVQVTATAVAALSLTNNEVPTTAAVDIILSGTYEAA